MSKPKAERYKPPYNEVKETSPISYLILNIAHHSFAEKSATDLAEFILDWHQSEMKALAKDIDRELFMSFRIEGEDKSIIYRCLKKRLGGKE